MCRQSMGCFVCPEFGSDCNMCCTLARRVYCMTLDETGGDHKQAFVSTVDLKPC